MRDRGKKVTMTQLSVSSCQSENIEVQASNLCKIVSNMQLFTFLTIPKYFFLKKSIYTTKACTWT